MNRYAKFEPSHAARQREKHEPMSTVAELAEEFGTSVNNLAKLITDRPGAPAPLKTGRMTYYPRRSMRAWYFGSKA